MPTRRRIRRTTPALRTGMVVTLALAAATACAQQPREDGAPKPPDVIGKVMLNREKKYAEVAGTVCLEEDMTILDYLCVAGDSGKEYESLFRLECKPSSLHAALLALGARPGSIPPKFKHDRPDMANIEDKRPPGSKIGVSVIVVADGAETETSIEAWLTDRRTGKPPADMVWIFTGSFFAPTPDGKGTVYMADQERLIASVLYHSACALNLASDAGSPYQGEDLGYEIAKEPPRPRGAKVRLRFQVVE